MAQHSIVLGPVLGLEQDTLYSVIFVSKKNSGLKDVLLKVSSPLESQSVECLEITTLHSTKVYKFTFNVTAQIKAHEVHYAIHGSGVPLVDQWGQIGWSFVVPGASSTPKIGFASCNGNHRTLPQFQPNSDYVMWERLFDSHSKENLTHAFHCLILGGDQVYADPIWQTVPYFEDHDLLGWNSTHKVAAHNVADSDLPQLMKDLETFYEDLYVKSWSKPGVAKVLAVIPTVMMWDDHDIFDGWGSQAAKLQRSQLFNLIFEVAKKYFEALQIRGPNNKSLISGDHYSLQFRFRNYEIFALDNRSHRTRKRVMSDGQLKDLKRYYDANLFDGVPKELEDDKVLLFAIAVPVAHLNYKKRTESILSWLSPFDFLGPFSFNDDAIDHWDHSNHEIQQKWLLDYIFTLANQWSPKYAHIVSGDVHSGGMGRIAREGNDGKRTVNEFISSPIVYKPVGGMEQWLLERSSDQYSQVDGYEISVEPFGFGMKQLQTVYQKNFACLHKNEGQGLKVYFTFEHMDDDYPEQPVMYFHPADRNVEFS